VPRQRQELPVVLLGEVRPEQQQACQVDLTGGDLLELRRPAKSCAANDCLARALSARFASCPIGLPGLLCPALEQLNSM
jgi:hypothetical protein